MQDSVKDEIEFVKNIKTVSQAYQQISVIRIQRIRNKVLENRNYMDGLSEVYKDIKRSYKRKITDLLKKEKTITENSMSIFISAQDKLYGEIVKKVFDKFLERIKNNPEDKIIIIGRLGLDMWKEVFPLKEVKYFDLPSTDFSRDQLQEIVKYISDYSQINVFHGEYKSLMTQEAIKTNISGEITLEKGNEKNIIEFLYEPSIEELMKFFEDQIFTALFKQSVHESDLSRHASRIKAMEYALNNINQKEKSLKQEQLRQRNKQYNKNQITSLLGISLWKK